MTCGYCFRWEGVVGCESSSPQKSKQGWSRIRVNQTVVFAEKAREIRDHRIDCGSILCQARSRHQEINQLLKLTSGGGVSSKRTHARATSELESKGAGAFNAPTTPD